MVARFVHGAGGSRCVAVLLRGRRCLRPAHQQGGVPLLLFWRWSCWRWEACVRSPTCRIPTACWAPWPIRAPGIFLEALLLGLLAVVAIVFAVLVKRQAGAGVRKALALVGMVLALAFTFSCRVFVPHGLAGGVEHAHLAARLPGHGRSIGHGRVGGADRRAERGRGGGAPVRLGSAGRRCCGVGAVCGIRFRLGHGRGRAGVAVLGRGGGVRRRPAYGVWLGYGQAS